MTYLLHNCSLYLLITIYLVRNLFFTYHYAKILQKLKMQFFIAQSCAKIERFGEKIRKKFYNLKFY